MKIDTTTTCCLCLSPLRPGQQTSIWTTKDCEYAADGAEVAVHQMCRDQLDDPKNLTGMIVGPDKDDWVMKPGVGKRTVERVAEAMKHLSEAKVVPMKDYAEAMEEIGMGRMGPRNP